MREVTATCPPTEIRIDRSFAKEPPACVAALNSFAFTKGGAWAGLAIEGAEGVAQHQACLIEIDGWINSERDARTNGADND